MPQLGMPVVPLQPFLHLFLQCCSRASRTLRQVAAHLSERDLLAWTRRSSLDPRRLGPCHPVRDPERRDWWAKVSVVKVILLEYYMGIISRRPETASDLSRFLGS
jgi:hypothetical protein